MRCFITKYALTGGIFFIEAEQTLDSVPDGSMISDGHEYESYYHGEGREWHRDRASAVARAEQMRLAKIASLRKQIAKLEALSFQEASDATQA